MKGQFVETTADGALRGVILNRRDKLNALCLPMLDELGEALAEAAADDVAAVVFGGGAGAFCAGFDLDLIAGLNASNVDDFFARAWRVFERLIAAPMPIIAVIDGPAFGAGFDMSVMCDMRVASARARFCQPEVAIGVSGLIDPLTRIVGEGLARQLAYTAEVIDGAEAYRIGLANIFTDQADPLPKARELAQKIARNDLAAVRRMKLLAREGHVSDIVVSIQRQLEHFKSFLGAPESVGRAAERLSKIRRK